MLYSANAMIEANQDGKYLTSVANESVHWVRDSRKNSQAFRLTSVGHLGLGACATEQVPAAKPQLQMRHAGKL